MRIVRNIRPSRLRLEPVDLDINTARPCTTLNNLHHHFPIHIPERT